MHLSFKYISDLGAQIYNPGVHRAHTLIVLLSYGSTVFDTGLINKRYFHFEHEFKTLKCRFLKVSYADWLCY